MRVDPIPPLLHAIRHEADVKWPGRSIASDGTIGDAAHQAQGSHSDHNPDARGIVHAIDITHDPAHGFDAWEWAQIIGRRMLNRVELRVKYLVAFNPALGHDVILDPAVSPLWRLNGTGQEHRSHLHTSILSGAGVEQSTAPYFVNPGVPDVLTTDEHNALIETLLAVRTLIAFISADKGADNLPIDVTLRRQLRDANRHLVDLDHRLAAIEAHPALVAP